MRKIISLSLVSAALLLSVNVHATTKTKLTQPKAQKQQALPDREGPILVYAQPNSKKIVQHLPAFSRLVLIIRKGEWAKVGNPQDGTVGWVNLQQWQSAQRAQIKWRWTPDVQSVLIESHGDKWVAYRNGKQVPEKEAEAMMRQYRAQQLQQQRAMNQYFRNVDRLMNWNMQQMQDMINHQVIFMPGPVIMQPKQQQAKTATHKTSV